MIITEKTTLAELEAELSKRGVSDLHARLNQKPSVGASSEATLHALCAPSGHAWSRTHSGVTLAHALNALCAALDSQVKVSICVRDGLGRLRGRYDDTTEGQRLAQQHASSLGRGASIRLG